MRRLSYSFDSRWSALIVLCTGMLMIVLDNTVVNVALSSIQHDLGFTNAGLAWPVNAYMIAFGGTLLLAGRLGDLVGTKRIFAVGICIFTVASLLCGLSNSQWMLVGARFVQGLGGAMASAVILAMIFTTFTGAHDRAKALSVFSFTASAGGSVGLLVGGVLTQALNWHWIFFVNVPIGIATYFFAKRIIPDAHGIGIQEGADGFGASMLTLSLMLAVYAVVQVPQGESLWQIGACGAVSVALMAMFVVRQARSEKPLLPLHVFRAPNVVWSNVLQVLVVTGLFAFFFLYSLYLRRVLEYDAIRTGLAFLPITIAIGILSVGPSARLMQRFGPRVPLIAGLLLSAAGLAVFALASPHASFAAVILPAMLLMGVGMGIAFPCVMDFAMSTATPSDAGLISGLVNTSAEVGGALGLAVLAAIAATYTSSALSAGLSSSEALTAGYRLAFGICTICLLLSAAISAFGLQMPRTTREGCARGAVQHARR